MSIFLLHPHGGMGDLLLSYPVIQAFAEAYPQKKIFYVTPPGLEEVVKVHPLVHRVLSYEAGKSGASLLALMRESGIEIGCALWTTSHMAWLLYRSGAKVRIGQGGRFFYSFLFTHRVAVRSALGDSRTHWVECLLDYPRALGLNPKNKEIALLPSSQGKERLRFLFQYWKLSPQEPFVVIHSGKGEEVLHRNWPLQLFASIGDALTNHGFCVIFTGSKKEIPLVEGIQRHMKRPSFSFAGETDFQTLAALLQQAKVVICPDSGPMHLSAAVGTPVVALFAMKKDFPNRWAPWQVDHCIIRPKKFPCRFWCTKENCPDFRCYHALSAEEIVACALKLAKESAIGKKNE
jgi:ADP-heptose:LPS heptosyltransferase